MKQAIVLTKRDRRLLETICIRLRTNPTNQVNICKLLQGAGMDVTKARQLFKQTYGSNPGIFKKQAVFAKAKHLLQGGELPIKQVAALCGYSSMQNFSTAFKKHTGYTPKQYQATFSNA